MVYKNKKGKGGGGGRGICGITLKQAGHSPQTGYQSVQTSVPSSTLAGGWHSLAVSVSASVATVYVDGGVVTTR